MSRRMAELSSANVDSPLARLRNHKHGLSSLWSAIGYHRFRESRMWLCRGIRIFNHHSPKHAPFHARPNRDCALARLRESRQPIHRPQRALRWLQQLEPDHLKVGLAPAVVARLTRRPTAYQRVHHSSSRSSCVMALASGRHTSAPVSSTTWLSPRFRRFQDLLPRSSSKSRRMDFTPHVSSRSWTS